MAEEQTGIQRVVGMQRFSNRHDTLAVEADFGRVVRPDRLHFLPVDAQQHFVRCAGDIEKPPQHLWLEDVIAHHQGERPARDAGSRGQNRHTVFLGPVVVVMKVQPHSSRHSRCGSTTYAVGVIPEHKVHIRDAGAASGDQRAYDERYAGNRGQ